LDGVSGLIPGVSGSALRINCRAVSGDPFVEGVDLRECGLPEGVDRENEGRYCPDAFRSGVRGDS
jgi:hypothetical protein